MSVQTALRRLRPKIAQHVNVRAEALRAEEYDTLERHRIGRGVMWPGNRVPSSKEYEPPARQTGRLQESIAVTKRATPFDASATVGPRPQAFRGLAPYPYYLEFGTRRMAPRPFVRPSIESFKRKIR